MDGKKKKKDNCFKKSALFSDIHFGLKHNSRKHNNDCEEFIIWFCEEAKKRGAETCIFLGDWHHHRNTINVSTLNYTTSNLKRLSDNFEKVYFIVGNHDLFYREKREIHSLPMADRFPNIIPIQEPLEEGDCAFVPWIVNDEWKTITKIKAKYMFGHFELPGFKLNSLIEMPDHGGLNKTHFKNQELVFSGHFHKRQNWQNVHYIGNPFGHNYADAWDFERGATFLEWDGVPEFVQWTDGPKYMTTTISQIAENPEKFLVDKASIKAVIDVDLSYEEVNYMKETFVDQFNIRELKLIPGNDTEHEIDDGKELVFETVNEIVVSQLNDIDSDTYEKEKLIDIYNRL